MLTDSSSTDDEFDKIKEAVDENFLTKDLFTKGELEKKSENLPKQSSRRNHESHQKISINPFSIKVTPEFQKHVSKHLSKLLDELIDDSKLIMKKKKLKTNQLSGGIKLLFSSKSYLKCVVNNEKTVKLKRFAKKEILNSSDYRDRAKEVAVTSEWILSQEETKCWAPLTKGEIEIIKLNNYLTRKVHKTNKLI